MTSEIESQKFFWPGLRKEKDEEDFETQKAKTKLEKAEVSPKKMEQATELSEQAEKLAKQGYQEKNEQKIQEAREMLAKAHEILEGKETEETEGILEGREDKEVLEKLFNEQKQELLDLGYPKALGMNKDVFLTKYIEPLRKELNKVPENIPEGNLPFLIVIPDYMLDIEKKMSMIKLDQETGYVRQSFDFEKLKDAEGVETPKNPYLIFDIENGAKTKNISPNDCVKHFAEENRRGFTTQEGIDLIAHYPKILQSHSINMSESQVDPGYVADIWFMDGCPRLGYNGAKSHHSAWGSPSCLRRQ